MTTGAAQPAAQRGTRFFKNVLWNWLGVVVSLGTGLVLGPYIYRKLGDEGYGVWSLVFAFVEYYWLMDLGFGSAAVRYTAHYRARGEPDKINEVINTGLTYGAGIAVAAIAASFIFAHYSDRVFQISPAYRDVFSLLIIVVGSGWAAGTVFNVLGGCMEGFQRFDIGSRIWMVSVAIRSLGLAAVLASGYKLAAMGAVVVFTQVVVYALNYICVRRVFPELRISPFLATRAMFREMLHYGIHTFLANISLRSVNQSAPLLIGHFMPTAFVGYYRTPANLMQYTVDLVNRVGFVTRSSAAELAATGDMATITRMGLYVNRYCYTLFAPMAIAMTVYGQALLAVWYRPEFAEHAGPLLAVMAVGTTLGIAAQFNSSSILYGMGKHHGFARSMTVEAILSIVLTFLVVPKYGILGAAWVSTILMVLNRGVYTAWLLSRSTGCSFREYFAGIYLKPTLIAIPTLLAGYWIKQNWLRGTTWAQALTGMASIAVLYYAMAFFVCLKEEHQALPLTWIRTRRIPQLG